MTSQTPTASGASRDAGPGPQPPQDRTGARTEPAADEIGAARERIDDLDRRIIALVQERMAVSEQIQRTRIASGGRRVNLSRETEILDRFHRELGRPGTQLAMTLLELSRGRP